MDAGLTTAEVDDRRQRGLTNAVPTDTSRSFVEIFKANVFTRFNLILGVVLVVVLAIQAWGDALFGVVLVSNAVIGIYQEVRAKKTLDRLALISAPLARVIRDGEAHEIALSEVVQDDLLDLAAGDQVVVDGRVTASEGLEVDESLLTGESDSMPKLPGDEVLSGSVVIGGRGRAIATRVGKEAYASKLAAEGKRFNTVQSELRAGTDSILKIMTWCLLPTAALLIFNQLRVEDDDVKEAIKGAVAGVVGMIPEGLVLLTSMAFAVGVIRVSKRRVLVQEMAAIEVLARVDTVCLDKTGTITQGELTVEAVEPVEGVSEDTAVVALAALRAAESRPNATLTAIGVAFAESGSGVAAAAAGWVATATVPFSSARKWSGASFQEHGTWLLGGPDVLVDDAANPARVRADELSQSGTRTVVLARTAEGFDGEARPGGIEPVALVRLAERMRPDAGDTIRYFLDQGMAIKVISGDNHRTVGAVAAKAGVPGADEPVDARTLPDDMNSLAAVLERRSVFGRVTPEQKRAMVHALHRNGHVVAMTGDGVNDVLALKDADIGVSMGSGSAATRAVARLVLLDNAFSALPHVVAEGRRVIGNVERVANLFVTKSVYAFLLAIAVGVASLPFPFLPRHLTIVSALTIGVPAFFLALGPNAQRARPGFAARVMRFAAPAGATAAGATFIGYAAARQQDLGTAQSRTVAVLVLFMVGLWILTVLARPMTGPRGMLVLLMVGLFLVALVLPISRDFFELETLGSQELINALVIGGLGALTVELGWRLDGAKRMLGPSRPAAEEGQEPSLLVGSDRRLELRSEHTR